MMLAMKDDYTDFTGSAKSEVVLTLDEKDPTETPSIKQVRIGILISSVGVGIFIASIDGTITNVSLPVIANDLAVEQNIAQWVILAYLLTLIGFTAIAGDLGDRFSNKIILQIGTVIFVIGSLFCALSTTLLWLVLARILQALGACCGMANGTAIITRFTTKENRGMALGLNALIVAAGITVGPIIGGLLTDRFGWPSIFYINIPLGIIGFIYVQFGIPKTPPLHEERREADVIGSISFMLFLTLLVFSLTVFVDENIPSPSLWGGVGIATSAIIFVIFFLWEKRSEKPIIDLNMFKNRRFAFGILAAVLAYQSLNVIFYQLPFYLREMQNLDVIQIGIIILGAPIGMAVVGPFSGKLSDRIDPRLIASLGMLGITIDLLLLSIFLEEDTPYWFFMVAALILGISLGAFISPNSNSIMSAAPKEKLGVAGGLMNLSTQVGFSIGTALSTAVFFILRNSFHRSNGLPVKDPVNYIPAMKIMFAIFVGVGILSVLVSYLRGPEEGKKDLKLSYFKIMKNEEVE
jgi:EmrB/QacA subfamily drug resistance transporter